MKATVFLLAGGGYHENSAEETCLVSRRLLNKHVVVVPIKYSVSPCLYPMGHNDVCSYILHYILRNQTIRPAILLGLSAGAHLAATSVLTEGQHSSSPPLVSLLDGIALWYPLLSLIPPTHEISVRGLLGQNPSEKKRQSLSISKETLRSTKIPVFLAHSIDDPVVPVSQVRSFIELLKYHKFDVDYYLTTDGGHGMKFLSNKEDVWRRFEQWLSSLSP